MEMTTKTFTLLAIASSTSLPISATTKEILSKIRDSRPTTLQALKDIEHDIKDEIKTIKKTKEHQTQKCDRNFQELKAAQTDIKNQIHDFVDPTKNRQPLNEQIKEKAKQFKNKVTSTTECLPSSNQIKKRARQFKDDAQEEALVVKHKSNRMWKRFVHGVKKVPTKIKNLFTRKKR